MLNKYHKPTDFSQFLLDDEFIRRINDHENSGEYINLLKKFNPDQSDDIDLAVKIFSGMNYSAEQSSLQQRKNIWKRIIAKRERKRLILNLKVAASFLLLFGLGGTSVYLFLHDQKSDIEMFTKNNQPSFDQAQLILSDGQQISISDYESKITYSRDGAKIIINDSTKLVQQVKNENFNQLIVPYGKYNYLKLSDGTKVWINSGSRLVYPPVFSGKTREVYVQGEAYFEVAENIEKPFYVKTDRFQVKVIGTRFNVQANENDQLFSTLLLSGEVLLTSGHGKLTKTNETRLQPGQLASLSSDNNNFDLKPVEHPENFIAWKNGYLHFREEPLNDVLQRISRFYNIPIENRSSIRSLKISGKLDLKDDPERVLNGVAIIARSFVVKDEKRFVLY